MTVTIPPIPPDVAPQIPPRVRTIAYVTAFAVGVLGSMVIGIVAVVQAGGGSAAMTAGIVGVLVTGASTVAGGLGTVFRPTAGQSWSGKPPVIDGDTWGDGTPVNGPSPGEAYARESGR